MTSSPPPSSPLKALKAAESQLATARDEQAAAEARVKVLESALSEVKSAVEAARRSALLVTKPRTLLKAYALWLLLPAWPGAYLFYLGRDAHAWLHTVTFGGFGVGWLLDAFYIPLYVADHNEPDEYLEGVERRHRRWLTLSSLLVPLRLVLTLGFGVYVGLIAAYLVPRPLAMPKALARALGSSTALLTKQTSASVGFCVGMLASALVVQLAMTRLSRTRTMCRWRPLLGWAVMCAAIFAPAMMEVSGEMGDELAHTPGLMLGTGGMMIGAATGRRTDLTRSPRRCTVRRLSVRLLVQLVGVCAFAVSGVGAFYLNGKYTYTDKETNRTHTLAGPEALRAAYESLHDFSGELKTLTQGLWQRQRRKTWAEIWADVLTAFRDPSREAAEVLGVSVDAPADEVKQAYRKLARLHHPDKVSEPSKQEEAKQLMARINWAKETLLGGRDKRADD